MADITINANPAKKLTVDLAGIEYLVKPPKMSVLVIVAKAASEKAAEGAAGEASLKVLDHLDNLVKIMFGKVSPAVFARLSDAEDDLDYPHIMDMAEKLIEAGSEGPTT